MGGMNFSDATLSPGCPEQVEGTERVSHGGVKGDRQHLDVSVEV